jgi:hypothetical protein
VVHVALSVNGQAPVAPGRSVADRTEGNGVEPNRASTPVRRLVGTMPARWADALR